MSVAALVGVALGTLVSEDLATIAAGGLVRAGQSPFWLAATACVAGVYVGDLALWMAGRVLGRRALTLPWVARVVPAGAATHLAEQLDRGLGAAVLLSRFVPGSRLPMYLVAGTLGRRPMAFAAWSLVAVLLWTPLLLWVSLSLGTTLASVAVGEAGTLFHELLGALGIVVALRVAVRLLGRDRFRLGPREAIDAGNLDRSARLAYSRARQPRPRRQVHASAHHRRARGIPRDRPDPGGPGPDVRLLGGSAWDGHRVPRAAHAVG